MAALMQALDAKLPRDDADAAGRGGGGWAGTMGGKVRELFEIELESTSRCAEAGAEDAAVVQKERVLRLALNIDSKTNVIHDAIKASLAYEISKNSPSLKREATYNVTNEISRLPPYLAVQFVRFYWRKDTKKKAKICRNVYFPTVLDMLPYCTEGVRIPIEKELAERRAAYMRANPVWDNVDQNDDLAVKWAQMDRDEAEDAERARLARLKAALEAGNGAELTEEDRAELEEVRARTHAHIYTGNTSPLPSPSSSRAHMSTYAHMHTHMYVQAQQMMEQERVAAEEERNATAAGGADAAGSDDQKKAQVCVCACDCGVCLFYLHRLRACYVLAHTHACTGV
jgi:hypothetical protein